VQYYIATLLINWLVLVSEVVRRRAKLIPE